MKKLWFRLRNKFYERIAILVEKATTVRLQNRKNNLIKNGLVEIGANTLTYYTPQFIIDHEVGKKIIVGKYSGLSDRCRIYNGSNHHADWISWYPFKIAMNLEGKFEDGQPWSRGEINIGNDVFVADDVTIFSGVTIGDGAVICPGAFVVRDIPPYTIAGGVPAKVIKKRFTDEQIELLLKIKWWEWEEKKIIEAMPLLNSKNIDEFLKKYS